MSRNLRLLIIFECCAVSGLVICLIQLIPLHTRSDAPSKVKTFSIQKANNSKVPNDIRMLGIKYKRMLKNERKRYLSDLGGHFHFTKEKVGLTSLTPETNGRPLQSLVLSTWRSGSTFLADILNAMPGSYQHVEPLSYMGNIQVQGSPQSIEAFYVIRQLLHCNYTGLEKKFFTLHKSTIFNTRLSKICESFPKACENPTYSNAFCRIFPFQSMKLVRLPTKYSEPLLADPQLNVKIVLLVRDPRGTMASRKHLDWCQGKQNCDSSFHHCQNLVSDFNAAQILTQNYPNQFKAIRYEDLFLSPHKVTKEVLDFYGLPFYAKIKQLLDSRVGENAGKSVSTAEGSIPTPFQWIHNTSLISFDEIQLIQSHCDEAMSLWGYNQLNDEQDRFEGAFNSLLPFES